MSTLADDLLPGAKKSRRMSTASMTSDTNAKSITSTKHEKKKTAGRSGRTAKTSCLARVS